MLLDLVTQSNRSSASLLVTKMIIRILLNVCKVRPQLSTSIISSFSVLSIENLKTRLASDPNIILVYVSRGAANMPA